MADIITRILRPMRDPHAFSARVINRCDATLTWLLRVAAWAATIGVVESSLGRLDDFEYRVVSSLKVVLGLYVLVGLLRITTDWTANLGKCWNKHFKELTTTWAKAVAVALWIAGMGLVVWFVGRLLYGEMLDLLFALMRSLVASGRPDWEPAGPDIA